MRIIVRMSSQRSGMRTHTGNQEINIFFIGLSVQARWGGSFELLLKWFWPLNPQLEFFKDIFYFLTHIFDEKKSAQIRPKMAPIARTTSRVGEIWSQIVFLIFWKIQYPDSGYFQLRFSSQNLDLVAIVMARLLEVFVVRSFTCTNLSLRLETLWC